VVAAVVVGFVVIGLVVKDDNPDTPAAQQIDQKPSPTFESKPAGHTVLPTPPASSAPTTPSNLPALNCSKAPAVPGPGPQFAKPPKASLAENAVWRVTLQTNCGPIVMDLDGKVAPQTVASFLFLAQKHYFDDSPCHRLTTAAQGLYVLQCGDPSGTGTGGPGYGFGLENTPKDGSYPTGTVAMARTADPNSNGSQFFIVYQDTTLPTDGGGYSIFGNVVKGLPIVQAVAARGLAADQTAPAQPISILHVDYAKQ